MTDLLDADNPPETVADFVDRVRCSQCGAKGITEYRIVYQPADDGAFDAMRGAEQRRDD
ncbi:hypothetical protein [Falsiphaeobacter marinintestinus]|uniref:hypothetical protein n=1 Tax=Falsiphaeobacter marinintestinus TaxID=1492905 RepID=UPI0016458D3C|nr:hypothetical protein [Phaeobacter marinintestinus]